LQKLSGLLFFGPPCTVLYHRVNGVTRDQVTHVTRPKLLTHLIRDP